MKKLNILIVSHSFPPIMNVGGMRAYSWAKYWSELGHEVTVITSKARSEFSYTTTFNTEVPEGVRIIEIENPLFKYFYSNNEDSKSQVSKLKKGKGTFKKVKKSIVNLLKNNAPVADYYFDWYYKSILYIKKNKAFFSNFDFVISTANPISAHSIGMYLKKKYDLIWIADYRDLEEQTQINKEIGFFRRKHINIIKKRMLEESDLDVTVSDGLRDILFSYKKDNKIAVIYNGYFEENYIQSFSPPKLKWNIVYSGSFYENQFDIKPLFKALDLLVDEAKITIPKVTFYGTYTKSVENHILGNASPQVAKKVCFKPSVDNKEIAQIQMNTSMLLLIDNLDSKGVLLTKSYEYLASQRPIIAIVNPESELATNFLNNRSGYYVGSSPSEIKEYIEKIHGTISDENSKDSLKYYNKDDLHTYSRKSQAMILLEQVKKIIADVKN